MIARGFRLRKATDFTKTYRFGKSYNHPTLFIKALEIKLPSTRIAVVVPKKISKRAVVRNRARRRVYEICRLNLSKIRPGYTIIITAKSDFTSLSPSELTKIVIGGLKQLKIIV